MVSTSISLKASTEKDNSFVVCSQLIERKKIDGILEKFAMYLNQYNSTCWLYIIGEGELKEKTSEDGTDFGNYFECNFHRKDDTR